MREVRGSKPCESNYFIFLFFRLALCLRHPYTFCEPNNTFLFSLMYLAVLLRAIHALLALTCFVGTMSLTTSKTIYRAGFGPLMAGVHTTPFPYCFRCKVKTAMNKHEDQHFCCGKYEEEIEHLLKMQTAPSETAAILVEPVQGEGGYVPAPKGTCTNSLLSRD
jgi:hypothetical protein